MDFFEQLFQFSPDGGNGSFECLLFLVPLLTVAVLRLAWKGGAAAASGHDEPKVRC